MILTLLALSACGGGNGAAKNPPQLHLACQTVECECHVEGDGLFGDIKTTEIVWRLNGDAICPPGFVLKRLETDFLGRRR